jgi:enamine deaminase RidA (YjgF/YER057c/UK114 family)
MADMTITIAQKLAETGRVLPEPARPAGNYVPATRVGNLLFIAGQIAKVEGAAPSARAGAELTLDQARKAAEAAGLGVLAQIAAATGGKVAAVRRIARLGVFVASTPDFAQQPEVANGASDLMAAVFGDQGRHARTAVGAAALPRGAAVEVEAIVELAE